MRDLSEAFPFVYRWDSDAGTTGMVVIFHLEKKTEYSFEVFYGPTWTHTRAYWQYEELVEWTSPRAALKFFGSTESDSSCPMGFNGSAWECPPGDLEARGQHGGMSSTLWPGRYSLHHAAYGADENEVSLVLATHAPIEVESVRSTETKLVLLRPDEDGVHRGSIEVAAPFFAHTIARGGALCSVRAITSAGENVTLRLGPPDPGERAYWHVEPSPQHSLSPNFAAPAGDWRFEAIYEDEDSSEEMVLVGLTVDSGFVTENGTLDAFGPGVTAADGWLPNGPYDHGEQADEAAADGNMKTSGQREACGFVDQVPSSYSPS